MTSSTSVTKTDTASNQIDLTLPSSEIFPTFSNIAKRDMHKSQMTLQDKKEIRYCLDLLDAKPLKIDGHLTFSEQKDLEYKTHTIYLGLFLKRHWFIPKTLPDENINTALIRLSKPNERPFDVKKGLYELWLVTRHEKLTDQDTKAMLNVYYERLKDYNPNAVLIVLQEFSESSKWFPSWCEISDRLSVYQGEQLRMFRLVSRIRAKRSAL